VGLDDLIARERHSEGQPHQVAGDPDGQEKAQAAYLGRKRFLAPFLALMRRFPHTLKNGGFAPSNGRVQRAVAAFSTVSLA
jgi:hypothetical protein